MRDPVDTYMNTLVPMVVEQTNRGERAYDSLKGLTWRTGMPAACNERTAPRS